MARLSIAALLVPMLTGQLLDFIVRRADFVTVCNSALICLSCWFVVPVFYKFSRPYMYIGWTPWRCVLTYCSLR